MLDWGDLHEGILEFVHFQKGWPSGYGTTGDMPAETALVFEYCLRTYAISQAPTSDRDEMLRAAQALQEREWARLTGIG